MCDGEKVRHAWIYGGMCEIRPPVYRAQKVEGPSAAAATSALYSAGPVVSDLLY